MDPKTRRANFKKIQTANQAKLRSTRSAKAATTPMTLSEYFTSTGCPSSDGTPEEPEQDPLFAEPKTKKARESQDVEPAPLPKPKKAPKLKAAASSKRGRGGGRGRGKQQPSISDFLRNEQLFAEVTAQHCIADNFSPDDIEMALALSKSEAEKHGRLRLQDTEDEREEEVNLLDDDVNKSTDNIRRKLQKYGFRTAAKEEYNMMTIATLPTAAGKRGKRCKWANKFTPLTLRNPEEQLKKLTAKVKAVLAQQVRTQVPSADLQPPFELVSQRLLRLEASAEQRIHHEPTAESLTDISAYYVLDLFEISRTPAHHLLKNWSAIPGRDSSPKRLSAGALRRQQQLEQVYQELEAHFGAAAEQNELDELEKLVADNMIQDSSQVLTDEVREEENQLPVEELEPSSEEAAVALEPPSQKPVAEVRIQLNESPLKEPPDKRAKFIEEHNQEDQDKENLQPSSASMLSIPTQSTRCTSPDLFADSDEESDKETTTGSTVVGMHNFSLKVYQNIDSTEMSCYEVYSSDEAKTKQDAENEQVPLEGNSSEVCIDLTQDEHTPELVVESDSKKSFFEQSIFEKSPSICFDDNNESEKESSAHEISDRLDQAELSKSKTRDLVDLDVVDKRAFNLSLNSSRRSQASTLHFDHVDNHSFNLSPNSSAKCNPALEKRSFNLSSNNSAKSHSNLFHLDLAEHHSFNLSSDKSDATSSFQLPSGAASTTDSILSFSHLENTKMAFNLSRSSGQEQEHSFKSSLSRRSHSFANRSVSPATTPLSHSVASIDLTQDSGDEEDDDDGGALLSDDEINYSIWKADNPATRALEESSDNESIHCSALSKIKSMPFFKTEDDLDAYLDACSMPTSNSRSPNKSALSKERAEFGILDAAASQPLSISQSSQAKPDSSQVNIDWEEASFLDTPPEAPIKRYSSNATDKFKELLSDIVEPAEDIDEFDQLVFGKKKEDSPKAVPSGLDQLLMGEINVESLPQSEPSQEASQATACGPDQLEVNGQVYNVRVCHSPKPDFLHMTEAELLNRLYKYGIKPLKRKQAVKLLEYIYNQTHPIMLPLEPVESEPQPLPRSKSTPLTADKAPRPRLLQAASHDCLTPTETDPQPILKFHDACGEQLLRFSQATPPALCDDFEYYVLQTNVTKKTPQPLVPLHIAWHNLLCANPSLHESVLMYEPIDLQEIYLFFKQLGQRYEPKDLKGFFDRRCIIFRYELAPPSKQGQRHVRKPKSQKANRKYK